jgi:hypothetical protein
MAVYSRRTTGDLNSNGQRPGCLFMKFLYLFSLTTCGINSRQRLYARKGRSPMGAQSKIEWTDSTFNPWVGCTKVARARGAPSACDFCYAEKWAKRSGQVEWGNHPRRRTTEAYWRNPLAWNNRARLFQTEHGRRQRVFCASLADVFDNQVDPSWRADLFNLIRACDERAVCGKEHVRIWCSEASCHSSG